MAMLRKRRHDEIDPFSDLLFNTLLAFVMLFALAVIFMNPKARTGVIDAKAEFIITVTWPDNNTDDVDTYVADPAGNIVWYNRREAGLMHLDRDDRGMFKDVLIFDGKEVENPLNQEIVSFRGLSDGEYTVNLVHYIANGTEPLPVSVKVEKLNPSVKVVFYDTVLLGGTGDEQTAVRFTLAGPDVTDVNNRPRSLVALTRDPSAKGSAPPGAIDAATGQVIK